MCKTLKKIFRKSFSKKRFVLMFVMFVSRIKQNKLFYNNRIDDCTSVEPTFAQAWIQQLDKHQIDHCTSVESTVILILLKKTLRFLDVPSVPPYY